MEDKNSNNMLKKVIAEERLKAVSFFEDAPCYPVEELVRMWRLGRQLEAKQTVKTVRHSFRNFACSGILFRKKKMHRKGFICGRMAGCRL